MADRKPTPQAPAIPADSAGGQQQVRIELDDSNVSALYANLCRVSSTPEEVILDLALNPNPLGAGTQALRVSQRRDPESLHRQALGGAARGYGAAARASVRSTGN